MTCTRCVLHVLGGILFRSVAGVEVTVLAQRLCKTRKCNDVVFPTSLPRCLSRKDMWVYFYSHGFGTQRRISSSVIMKTDVCFSISP